VHQQQQGRAKPCSQAGPLTPTPTTTASLMGQTNGWHGAHSIRVHTYRHRHDPHSKHLPHTSLSTRLLLPHSPDDFFFFTLLLFSLSGSSCSESWTPDSVGQDRKREIKKRYWSQTGRREESV